MRALIAKLPKWLIIILTALSALFMTFGLEYVPAEYHDEFMKIVDAVAGAVG